MNALLSLEPSSKISAGELICFASYLICVELETHTRTQHQNPIPHPKVLPL